jgi:hypothetical protein
VFILRFPSGGNQGDDYGDCQKRDKDPGSAISDVTKGEHPNEFGPRKETTMVKTHAVFIHCSTSFFDRRERERAAGFLVW